MKQLKDKKKYIVIAVAILLIASLIGVFININNKKKIEEAFEINSLDLSAYEKLNDDRHIFRETNVQEILNILEKDSALIYMGKTSCEHCGEIVPRLNKVAKEKGLKEVLYLDLAEYNSNEKFHDEVDTILDKLRYYFDQGFEIPIVIAVKDGKIVGFTSKETGETTYAEMVDVLQGTKESTFVEYFKPDIKVKDTYGELLIYEVGKDFDINDYIEITTWNDKKVDVHFEVINEEYDEYQNEGMHDIKIIATDGFEVSEIDVILLTQKEEVIKTLTADNYKPTVSDYKKYVEENPKAESKPSKGGTAVAPNKNNNQGTTTGSVNDDLANSIVGNSAYYNYGCEAIAGVYHGFSTPNDILDAGVYEVSDPKRGDIIAYFDAGGNYVHTGVYLGDGMALQGNWSGGKAVITSASYATYRKFVRLGGGTEYGRFIYDTAHVLGGKAFWLEDYYKLKDQLENGPQYNPEPEKEPEPSVDITWDEYYDNMSDEERALADACNEAGKGSEACQLYKDWLKAQW